ncbi:DUF3320 domain-containing protein [Pelagibius sp. CAU 1746]|uniref:DUF3320 domain-containing protein n=1 Tax=Pelagibius sp. CAU 1746 TaxID=3140370 RepID=UPI00325BCF0B
MPAASPVEISASIAQQITYATQQNDVAVIADLGLANHGEEDLEHLVLTLEVDPPLIAEKRWRIDRLAAGSELRLSDRGVSLSGASLSRITERRRAELSLRLTRGKEILAEERREIIGLAHNEWGGASHMPELLAAFVMPNDPAVARLLKEASEVLRRSGKNPSLEGYQQKSRKRVWEIAAALWAAVAQRRLTYVEPPASFERQGQKIRTPGEVLETGLATCLDSAVLFASALEQVGLNPMIAFTDGHAICGLWLQPQTLPGLTTDDASELRKHVDLKELLLFETTAVTQDPPMKFSKAIEAGNGEIAEAVEEKFVYTLDLRRARQQQISPLSTEREIDGGEGESEAVVSEGMEEAPELPGFDLGLETGEKPDTPEDRLDHWKRKLLDLTKRNRLLNLKPSKTAIPLICPDPAALEDKLAEGRKISVKPLVKISQEGEGGRDAQLFQQRSGEDYVKRFAEEALANNELVSERDQKELDAGLIQLYRKSKSDLQEGGANTLFLALGMLKWKQSEDETRSYRAPLILVPVTLERRSAASKVKITAHDDETVFNMTLLEMLRQDFDLRLPQLEGKLPEDEAGVDVTLIWNTVRKAVRDIKGFEVVEEVVISTFSFAKYLMWKDLSDRTAELKESPFVEHLIDHPRDPYEASAEFLKPSEIDEKIDPSELFMPLQADSSQIVAVQASSQGGDFVLEGPPGTGKSQTIANMIAHNLGLGRRVLFVSEKMAALEVVYRRLVDKGLGRFCLELHSSKANKKDVLNQLDQSWSARGEETAEHWQTEAARLKKLRDDLNGLVKALHSPGQTGVSPRAAIGRSLRFAERHRLELSWEGGLEADRARDREGLARLQDIARRLGLERGQIGPQEAKAFKELRQEDWSNAWQARFVEAARRLIGRIDAVLAAAGNFAGPAGLPVPGTRLAGLEGLAMIALLLPAAARHDLGFALTGKGGQVLEDLGRALDKLETYRSEKKKLSLTYSDEAIAAAEVEAWKGQWLAAGNKIWPFGALARRGVASRMKKAAALKKRPAPAGDLDVLEKLQAIRAEMEATVRDLPADAPWKGLESDIERAREAAVAGAKLREGATRLAEGADQLIAVRETLRKLVSEGQDLIDAGMPIAEAGRRLAEEMQAFKQALGDYVAEAAAEARSVTELGVLKDEAQGVLDLQQRINVWCRWQAVRNEALAAGLEDLVAGLESGLVPAEETEEAFKTAYCRWIAGRLVDEREELRTFSALAQEQKIEEFRKLDRRMADLAIDYIKARLSGDIPGRHEPKQPPGYGVLAREIQKKARHMPVRQLVGELGEVLTTLTPCLLMSPLSVAQFLAAGSQPFDVVIFDEASQITVWDAIGAIARGINVIVVGDPKQMPPTSFFERAASEDAEEESGFADDMESILDEALAARIKWHRLTGHYRSKHESLIAFSNHRYYGGDLVTYPSNDTKPTAVSFRKVKGIYQRGKGRTNPDEAKEVVAEVVRRLKDPALSRLSIGVVTLNSEQQRLVEELLDDERRQDPGLEAFFGDDAVEPVFIKNLETVQGDQRDVILLSVGYGPTVPGAQTMSMNFGPLNRKGGERRLNVAITRATTEVMIFASFDPSMIDLTRTSAAAVRDLRHYLEFAERGPAALGEALKSVGGTDSFDSDFEEAVAEGLRRRGWDLHSQIGVSKFRIDLGVIHPDWPGHYLVGLECDGATYHSSPSARDRDRVRQAILEGLGWRLLRIWSTDFFIDPKGTLERIDEALQKLLEEDRAHVETAEGAATPPAVEGDGATEAQEKLEAEVGEDEAPTVEDEVEAAPEDLGEEAGRSHDSEPAEAVRAFARQSGDPALDGRGALDRVGPELSPERFYDPDYLEVLRRLVLAVIDGEGPVTFDFLATRIAREHGFQRTGARIRQQVAAALGRQRRQSRGPGTEKVYWPDGQEPQKVTGFRGLNGTPAPRHWAEVPDPEKLGLARQVLEESKEADRAAVMARIIGLASLRQKTREEFEGLLRRAAELNEEDEGGDGGAGREEA